MRSKHKIPKSRIIVSHSKECFMRNNENPWSGLLDEKNPYYYGNFAANAHAKIGKHHIWYRVKCNCPSCPAIKAVHSHVLADAV